MTHAIATLAWFLAAFTGTDASTTEANLCVMVAANASACEASLAPPPPEAKADRPIKLEGAQRRISNGF